jgi:hypothetical protein
MILNLVKYKYIPGCFLLQMIDKTNNFLFFLKIKILSYLLHICCKNEVQKNIFGFVK